MMYKLIFLFTCIAVAVATTPAVLPHGRPFAAQFGKMPKLPAKWTHEAIEAGLDAGKKLADIVSSEEFVHSMIHLVALANPYLAIVAPVALALVKEIAGIESKEIKMMKQMMTDINAGFNKIHDEFAEVKRLIDWSAMQVQFAQFEQKIRAASYEMQLFSKAKSGAMRDNQKKILIQSYESDFQNSAFKLFDAMTNYDQVFSKNLFEASRKYSENYRKKTQKFMMGLTQLLIQGVVCELNYYTLKGYEENIKVLKDDWIHKLELVQTRMNQTDLRMERIWNIQLEKDVTIWSRSSNAMSPSSLNQLINYRVSNKYYWRVFSSIVFQTPSGKNEYKATTCSGTYYHDDKVTVRVSSRHANDTSVDISANSVLAKKIFDKCHESRGYWSNAEYVDKIIIDEGGRTCHPYKLRVVVGTKYHLSVLGHADRVHTREICARLHGCFDLVLFG